MNLHCENKINNNYNPCFIANAIGRTLYDTWFKVNNLIVTFLRNRSFIATAAIHGMVSLELTTLVRVAWKTAFTFSKAPKAYGLEKVPEGTDKPPVLLLHGAAGNWRYMGDLAETLTDKNIPVFVLSLGGGFASDEKRAIVQAKIREIQETYSVPKVDIVAHSMGGSLAHASMFDPSTSSIDSTGKLTFNGVAKASEGIGKVVTLALPLDSEEVGQIDSIGKTHDVYNITAKYDLLVGHKTPSLPKSHVTQINTTHIEIVYDRSAQDTLVNFLERP